VASLAFEDPQTIMRTRGMMSIIPDVTTADLSIVGAVGMGVVSQEAFAAGVASVPEPFTDADWGGWFVWRSFGLRFNFETAIGVNFVPANWQFEVDSKAMRRVTPNEVLVVVAESQGGAFAIADLTRHLFKLP